MLTGEKIPFVNENLKMIDALKIISTKKLGVLIVRNNRKITTGIVTDGQIRRVNQTKKSISNLLVKDIMTTSPIKIEKDELSAKALSIMNERKITSLCVYEKKNKKKTIGVLHIHNILENNIS